MVAITFNVPEQLEQAVREAANRWMLSRSAFLRIFLADHLKSCSRRRARLQAKARKGVAS